TSERLAKVKTNARRYGLGPVTSLKGQITVTYGQVFVSTATHAEPDVTLQSKVKAVFLVYASVPAWRSILIPTNVLTEKDLATFVQSRMPMNTRSAFLVRGTALSARYHIQNYKGRAKDLTHEAHDKAKLFYELANTPEELVG